MKLENVIEMTKQREKSFNIRYNIRQPHKYDNKLSFDISLDMHFYRNDIEICTFCINNGLESLIRMKTWIESVLLGKEDTFTFCGGNANAVILSCNPQLKAFAVEDISACNDYLIKLETNTKNSYTFKSNLMQLIETLYLSLIEVSASIVFCTKNDSRFYDRWKMTSLDHYNQCKSSIIEHYIYRGKQYCTNIDYTKDPIKDVMCLWTEYGDACFWGYYRGCYGGPNYISLYNEEEISLQHIEGLRTWYDEFDENLCEWENDTSLCQWFEQGISIAREIRKNLPPEVDLFYNGNGGSIPLQCTERSHVMFNGERTYNAYFPLLK